MKKLTFAITVMMMLVANALSAQNYKIVSASDEKIVVLFETTPLNSTVVKVPEGSFSVLNIDGFAASSTVGAPQLPVLVKLLSIPVCDSVAVSVLEANYYEISASELGIEHQIYPAQGSISKSVSKSSLKKDATIYSTDDFYSEPLIIAEKSGIMRNIAFANVTFSPIACNPVKNMLKICESALVEFKFVNVDATSTNKLEKYASAIFSADNSLFINPKNQSRNEYSEAPISYLIVANSMFKVNEDLQNFVEWKKQLGYYVKIAYTDDAAVGTTTTSIQNYIKSQFVNSSSANPAPDFLLLVGDFEQIPAFSGSATEDDHVSDLYYATTVGTDYIPDCYFGRLSAQTQEHLSAQLKKIMTYEAGSMEDMSYLGRAVLIAGTDDYFSPTHANGQINYIANNYVNNDLPRFNDVKVHLYNCSSQAATIRQEISSGTSLVNYTAHGYANGWADPGFNKNQVYDLQNYGKYGLMIGNCCLSGKFETDECFGEALLRVEDRGAMAYIGASNSSYWDEDYYWAVGIRSNIVANPQYNSGALGAYDRAFHTHGEAVADHVSTVGGFIFAGNASVQASSSTLKRYYWEIYHCFGDPSVRVYFGEPEALEVSMNPAIIIGEPSFTVTTEPYAYVALTTFENELVVAAFADEDGVVTLNVSGINEPGLYKLAASAQNHTPFFADVQVVMPNIAYVVPTQLQLSENQEFISNSEMTFDVVLSNASSFTANGVSAKLSTSNPEITLINDSIFVQTIAQHDAFSQNNAFSFILPYVEDGDKLDFELKLKWNDTMTLLRNVSVKVKLPRIVTTDFRTEKNNKIAYLINRGDTCDVVIKSSNKGHQKATNGVNDLTCNFSGVQVLSPSSLFSDIAAGASYEKRFSIKIGDFVEANSIVPLYYHTIYGNFHDIDTIYIMIESDFEGFESGDMSQHGWSHEGKAWYVTDAVKHSGNYSIRSASNLFGSSNSDLIITTATENASELSFFRKVSSEENYDFFYLYIDNDVVDNASGEVNWTQVSVPVPAGVHKIVFSYEKDYDYSAGSDCVWIDDVVLPCNGIYVVEDMLDEVGVEDFNPISVSVFPNPSTSSVTIRSEIPTENIVLFSANGQIVKNVRAVDSYSNLLNISDVPAGLYILQINFNDKSTRTLKIIKK